MKKFLSLIFSVMIISSIFTIPVSATENTNQTLITIENVNVTGESVTIPKTEFKQLIEGIPSVLGSQRIAQINKQETDKVTLSPDDLWLMFININDKQETQNYLREKYQGKTIEIFYDDLLFSVSPVNEVETYNDYEGTVTRYGENDTVYLYNRSYYGMLINITATFQSGSMGGSQYYTRYLNSSYRTSNIPGYYPCTVISSQTNHSNGNIINGSAWCEVILKLRPSLAEWTAKTLSCEVTC